MGNILRDLADSIRKSGQPSQPRTPRRQQTRQTQKPRSNSIVKSQGPGGVVFDFGPSTGNPMADNFTRLLNIHGDRQQMQIAADQRTEFNQALDSYVSKGKDRYESGMIGDSADNLWDKQFNKSTDETIKQLHKEGRLVVDDQGSVETPVNKSQFADKKIQVGDETVSATSETDAALIEMMKSGTLSEDDNGNSEGCTVEGS